MARDREDTVPIYIELPEADASIWKRGLENVRRKIEDLESRRKIGEKKSDSEKTSNQERS